MIELTKAQEEQMENAIYTVSNLPDTMKEDLYDHFYCTIEDQMQNGASFEDALEGAKKSIAPDGMESLHQETLYLLSASKVSLMKRSVRINGIIALVTAPIGVVFKLLHLPAANLILFLSALTFVFGFLPVFFTNSYKRELTPYLFTKVKYVAGYVSLFLLTGAGVFKLCHFPGGNILLVVGMVLLCFFYIPFLYFKSSKW